MKNSDKLFGTSPTQAVWNLGKAMVKGAGDALSFSSKVYGNVLYEGGRWLVNGKVIARTEYRERKFAGEDLYRLFLKEENGLERPVNHFVEFVRCNFGGSYLSQPLDLSHISNVPTPTERCVDFRRCDFTNANLLLAYIKDKGDIISGERLRKHVDDLWKGSDNKNTHTRDALFSLKDVADYLEREQGRVGSLDEDGQRICYDAMLHHLEIAYRVMNQTVSDGLQDRTIHGLTDQQMGEFKRRVQAIGRVLPGLVARAESEGKRNAKGLLAPVHARVSAPKGWGQRVEEEREQQEENVVEDAELNTVQDGTHVGAAKAKGKAKGKGKGGRQ